MFDWLKKKLSRPSYAEELYLLGKNQPMKYPHLSLKDSEPISMTVTLKVPKFSKKLAALEGLTLEGFLEKALVTTLYMEQGLKVDKQPINMEKNGKPVIYTKMNPKTTTVH